MQLTLGRRAGRLAGVLAVVVLLLGTIGPGASQTPPPQPAPPASKDQLPPETSQPAAQAPASRPTIELPADVLEPVKKLSGAIDQAEKSVQQLTELEEDLRRLRGDVEEILSGSTVTAEELRPQLMAVRALIEKLGAPPGKDAPPEAPGIAAERARLNGIAAQLDSAIKSTELTWARARQLIERITVLRHSLFTKNLLERLHSPLLPQLWRDVTRQLPTLAHRVAYQASDWNYWASRRTSELVLLLPGVVLLYALLRFIAGRILARHRVRRPESPSFFERGMAIAWSVPLRAAPPIGAAMLLYGGLDSLDLLYPPWSRVGAALLGAVIELSLMTSLIGAVMAPAAPQWRIVPLDDAAARRLARILYGIATVYVIDGALSEVGRAFLAPLTLTVVQSFLASLVFAALLIGLLLTSFTPQPQADAPPEDVRLAASDAAGSRHRPRWLKLPLWFLSLCIIGAAGLGYVALARFMAQQIVLTGMVVAVVWLLHLAIRAFTREPRGRTLPVTEMLEARFGIDEPRRNQLARLTEIALSLSLVICAIPVLMLQWGFSGADIRDWFKALLFGMEIGSFRISLARILIGILIFTAMLFTTRLFQHWLRDKALKETRLDSGVVDSIDAVVGYAGIAAAALLAVSYAGFDVTNLAIVAGALSVGIGFGLQSIVNNFVSGLILLIERPIKVGDRVVVGTEQGVVRRISVRATEIETFDKASLIVPNSELIMGRVLNWTHRDRMGAYNIKIGVAYSADPDQVLEMLKACASAHLDVLTEPAPSVTMEGFGDSALLFNLRVSIADLEKAGRVQSDLRVAILKQFRAANIDIPFHQVDVNMRDFDSVKQSLLQMLEERTTRAAGDGKKKPADAAS